MLNTGGVPGTRTSSEIKPNPSRVSGPLLAHHVATQNRPPRSTLNKYVLLESRQVSVDSGEGTPWLATQAGDRGFPTRALSVDEMRIDSLPRSAVPVIEEAHTAPILRLLRPSGEAIRRGATGHVVHPPESTEVAILGVVRGRVRPIGPETAGPHARVGLVGSVTHRHAPGGLRTTHVSEAQGTTDGPLGNAQHPVPARLCESRNGNGPDNGNSREPSHHRLTSAHPVSPLVPCATVIAATKARLRDQRLDSGPAAGAFGGLVGQILSPVQGGFSGLWGEFKMAEASIPGRVRRQPRSLISPPLPSPEHDGPPERQKSGSRSWIR